jgi:hypothetical protein
MQVQVASFRLARRAAPLRSRAYRIWIYRTGECGLLWWVFFGGTKRPTPDSNGGRCAFSKMRQIEPASRSKKSLVRLQCWKVAMAGSSCLILTRAQRADALAPQTRFCLSGTTRNYPTHNADWLARARCPSGGARARVNPYWGKITEETNWNVNTCLAYPEPSILKTKFSIINPEILKLVPQSTLYPRPWTLNP